METKHTKREWYNCIRESVNDKFSWPSMKGELQFAYSANQRQVTISHLEGMKIGITFSEEVTKRFDMHEELLEALREADKVIWYAKYYEAVRGGSEYEAAKEFADNHKDHMAIESIIKKATN